MHQAERVPDGSPSPSPELLLVRAGRGEGRAEWAGVNVGQGRSQAEPISNWHQACVYLGLGVVLLGGYG